MDDSGEHDLTGYFFRNRSKCHAWIDYRSKTFCGLTAPRPDGDVDTWTSITCLRCIKSKEGQRWRLDDLLLEGESDGHSD